MKRGAHTHEDSGEAFLRDPRIAGRVRVDDDLAEMLAEEFLLSATSAEEATDEIRGNGEDPLTLKTRRARGGRRHITADRSAAPDGRRGSGRGVAK
jgi:hypothetical protein